MFSFFKKNGTTKRVAETYVPDHQQFRKIKRLRFVFLGFLALVYFVFVVCIWFFLGSPFFHVKNVAIVGNRDVSRGEILSAVISRVLGESWWKPFFGINNMLIWREGPAEDALVFLPKIKSIDIKKNYEDGSILIKVAEREPYGIWCGIAPALSSGSFAEETSCWWFDEEGVIFKHALFTQGSLIMVVSDYSQNEVGLRSNILPKEFLPNALSILKALKSSGLDIKEIRLDDLKLEELEATTFSGPKIYFSLRFPANNTAEVIRSFIEKSTFKNLEYLDFRVENRVYYK